MSQRKNSNKKNDSLKKYIKYQLIILLFYFVLFLIFCSVSVVADVNKDILPYISVFFICVGSLAAGFFAGIKERKNGILSGLSYALPSDIIWITVSLILNGFKADIILPITVFASIILSALGGIISVNIKLK